MLTTDEAFDKFRKRLELSETEQRDAARRHAEVRDCIRGGFEVKTDFLSGSYKRHTKTKPLKDVDVLFILGEKENWRRDEPPIETLQAFEQCLKTKYADVEICRRAVTVEFEKAYYPEDHEGKVLSIDAVPAFESGDDEYEIPDKITGTDFAYEITYLNPLIARSSRTEVYNDFNCLECSNQIDLAFIPLRSIPDEEL